MEIVVGIGLLVGKELVHCGVLEWKNQPVFLFHFFCWCCLHFCGRDWFFSAATFALLQVQSHPLIYPKPVIVSKAVTHQNKDGAEYIVQPNFIATTQGWHDDDGLREYQV